MTRKERNEIVKFAEKLTDKELEKEYYDAAYNSLGSQCEDMYELGYDIADIVEREKYEKYLGRGKYFGKGYFVDKPSYCTDCGQKLDWSEEE